MFNFAQNMPNAPQELTISRNILNQPKLGDGAKLLYAALLAAMVPTDLDRLAGMIGQEGQAQSVKNSLDNLIEQGFVTVKEEQNKVICSVAYHSRPRNQHFTDFLPSSRSTRSRRRMVGGKR